MTKKTGKKKCYPTIDLGRCSDCRGCVEVAPEIFRYSNTTGMMEVVDLVMYSQEKVDEAIKNCPKDCIQWECFEGGKHIGDKGI